MFTLSSHFLFYTSRHLLGQQLPTEQTAAAAAAATDNERAAAIIRIFHIGARTMALSLNKNPVTHQSLTFNY